MLDSQRIHDVGDMTNYRQRSVECTDPTMKEAPILGPCSGVLELIEKGLLNLEDNIAEFEERLKLVLSQPKAIDIPKEGCDAFSCDLEEVLRRKEQRIQIAVLNIRSLIERVQL